MHANGIAVRMAVMSKAMSGQLSQRAATDNASREA